VRRAVPSSYAWLLLAAHVAQQRGAAPPATPDLAAFEALLADEALAPAVWAAAAAGSLGVGAALGASSPGIASLGDALTSAGRAARHPSREGR